MGYTEQDFYELYRSGHPLNPQVKLGYCRHTQYHRLAGLARQVHRTFPFLYQKPFVELGGAFGWFTEEMNNRYKTPGVVVDNSPWIDEAKHLKEESYVKGWILESGLSGKEAEELYQRTVSSKPPSTVPIVYADVLAPKTNQLVKDELGERPLWGITSSVLDFENSDGIIAWLKAAADITDIHICRISVLTPETSRYDTIKYIASEYREMALVAGGTHLFMDTIRGEIF